MKRKKAPAPATGVHIGYVRVSTDQQFTEGVSMEAQEARLQKRAEYEGHPIEILSDHVSGGSLDRPAMQEILRRIESRKVASVTVCKLDRLTRSVRDLIDIVDLFERTGTSLVSLSESIDTSTATGRMFIKFVGIIAEFEREIIGERTRDALRHKRSKREVYGEIPYGFDRVDDNLQVNPLEMKTARRIIGLIDGGIVQQVIADVLNRDGIKTKKGNAWVQASVARVLKCRDLYDKAVAA